MKYRLKIIEQPYGTYDVVGWDDFNRDEDQYFGNIFLHDDGKYWFQSSLDLPPLTHGQLLDISGFVSFLNLTTQ